MTQSSQSQKTVGIYCRVSTSSQRADLQLEQLRSVAERNNWVIVDEYIDSAVSGVKGRDERPEYDRLCKDITRKRFDLVAAFD
ncbi:MAG: resolvase, partial [Gammaproteobacteria bacterium]